MAVYSYGLQEVRARRDQLVQHGSAVDALTAALQGATRAELPDFLRRP